MNHRAKFGNQETPPESGHASLGELTQLLEGLERQKEELGPIADELIELLHRLGVAAPPRNNPKINPFRE